MGGADGLVLSPTQFNSDNQDYHLKSNAIFGAGEVYYDFTDDLKFTGGLRYTSDEKHFESKSIALVQPQPIGTTTPPPTGLPPALVGFGGGHMRRAGRCLRRERLPPAECNL